VERDTGMTGRVEQIGRATLYLGCARDVLPIVGHYDAIITDPPYGIGASTGVGKYGVQKWGGDNDLKWDAEVPSDIINELAARGVPAIIWGGNYFALPAHRCPLVWDKGAGFRSRTFAECEVAWSNLDLNARVFCRDPLAKGDYDGKEHPTQKPLALMRWCLSLIPDGDIILDPFAGAGSTGVAAIQAGRAFIGIEREEKFFNIACRRLREVNGDDAGPLFGEAA
jgi:tRNA G10  N-methylase Trm11